MPTVNAESSLSTSARMSLEPRIPVPGMPADAFPTRQSLLSRLKDWEDDRSWREFFDLYWRLIYGVAVKSGLSDAEAQDVVQETVLSVAKKMKEFRYDPAQGSFKGWLLQLTGWRIANQFNKRRKTALGAPRPQEPADSAATDEHPDPDGLKDLERIWEAEWEGHLLAAAMDRVKRQVNPAHFQMFDLAVIQRRPLTEITRFLGISAGHVYLVKHRVARLVQKEVRRLQSHGI